MSLADSNVVLPSSMSVNIKTDGISRKKIKLLWRVILCTLCSSDSVKKERPALVRTDAGLAPPLYAQPRSLDCMAENT